MDQKLPDPGQPSRLFAARRDPRNSMFAREFLDALVSRTALDANAAERALQAHRKSGQRIDVVSGIGRGCRRSAPRCAALVA